jgi:secondary thiamine-phosphate synthase enzyme
MPVYHQHISFSTKGETDIVDITDRVEQAVAQSGIKAGIVNVFVSGSTAGITTIEYESGLVQDLKEAMERLAPRQASYAHDSRWGDGNGYAHIRASLLGCSLAVPVEDGRTALGQWQQIVLVDFDNRRRNRNIVLTVVGD